MGISNNVTRMLDGKKVKYTAHELPMKKLSAIESAELLGVQASLVYKTIVARPESGGKMILALVPGDRDLDVKALAKAIAVKKVKVTSQNEAEQLTGLQTGGISPLALINKGFQVVIDASAFSKTEIFISGGQRGLNIQISPQDVVRLTIARSAEISSGE